MTRLGLLEKIRSMQLEDFSGMCVGSVIDCSMPNNDVSLVDHYLTWHYKMRITTRYVNYKFLQISDKCVEIIGSLTW